MCCKLTKLLASTPETIRFTLFCVELQFKINVFWASMNFLRLVLEFCIIICLGMGPCLDNTLEEHVRMLPILQVVGI